MWLKIAVNRINQALAAGRRRWEGGVSVMGLLAEPRGLA
jgi:hypothetical protein